jgi:hypothetical protein
LLGRLAENPPRNRSSCDGLNGRVAATEEALADPSRRLPATAA